MDIKKQVVAVLCLFGFAVGPIFSQDYESIDGALIYDHDPSTKLGDDVFGTLISDLEHDSPGRNSHGGPVCMEYPNGQIVAFNTNTSSHNLDGWSEYAVSRDGGEHWKMYNKFQYSYESYLKNPKQPFWVEQGLVTQSGTVVLFLSQLEQQDHGGFRIKSGNMRSSDNGSTWTDYESLDGDFARLSMCSGGNWKYQLCHVRQ